MQYPDREGGARLGCEAGRNGPYADNLNKVLDRMVCHFISGYGDSQKPDAEICLHPNAVAEADAFLADREDSKQRLQKVADLIEGFETPYGMELLASVHWLANHSEPPVADEEQAIRPFMTAIPRMVSR